MRLSRGVINSLNVFESISLLKSVSGLGLAKRKRNLSMIGEIGEVEAGVLLRVIQEYIIYLLRVESSLY